MNPDNKNEYLAFALKYRPKDFDQVVGQGHVISSLKNAITTGRVHHAYLFSGPRGVGKTSLARILAKNLNCEKGPTVKPCGKCTSCVEIAKGTSLDVIEIDGASNRGIDDIRALRESVKLSPAYSRYKIYIIDEIHQITSDGFNALLKTLEEPPSHVKFIFATTHPQKVLPTILSRCQKFQFTLFEIEKIIEKLNDICKKENLQIDKKILYSVARSAQGSIRDAESLLDQIAPIVIENGKVEDVVAFLGIISEESFNNILGYVVEKNIIAALDFLQNTINEGYDLNVFIIGFIEHLRCLLLAKVSENSFKNIEHISPETKGFIYKLSKKIDLNQIIEVIDLMIEAKDLSKKLNSIRIPLELSLIKFISPEIKKAKALTKKDKKSDKINDISKSDNEYEDDSDMDDLDIEEGFQPKKVIQTTGEKDPVAGDTSLTIEEVKKIWPQFISAIGKVRMSLSTYLGEAMPHSVVGGVLKIAFPNRFSFHKGIVEQTKDRKFIEDFLVKHLGKNLGIAFILVEDKEVPDIDKPKDRGNKSNVQEDNEFINELLDTFNGKLHTDNG